MFDEMVVARLSFLSTPPINVFTRSLLQCCSGASRSETTNCNELPRGAVVVYRRDTYNFLSCAAPSARDL